MLCWDSYVPQSNKKKNDSFRYSLNPKERFMTRQRFMTRSFRYSLNPKEKSMKKRIGYRLKWYEISYISNKHVTNQPHGQFCRSQICNPANLYTRMNSPPLRWGHSKKKETKKTIRIRRIIIPSTEIKALSLYIINTHQDASEDRFETK